MGVRRTSDFSHNPAFQKRLANSVLNFLFDIAESLLVRADDIESAAYLMPGADNPWLPTFDEIYYAAQTQDYFEITLILELKDSRILTVPITMTWGGYILASEFPNRPSAPAPDVYNFIRDYSFPIHDPHLGWNIVLFDSFPHHDHLITHPHHRHAYRNGVKDVNPNPFSGRLIQFVDEICTINVRT